MNRTQSVLGRLLCKIGLHKPYKAHGMGFTQVVCDRCWRNLAPPVITSQKVYDLGNQ